MKQNVSANTIKAGQLENTEEVLRKHYFMAKATQKTQFDMLKKQESPQKHMLKSKKMTGTEQHYGQLNKLRGAEIDQL